MNVLKKIFSGFVFLSVILGGTSVYSAEKDTSELESVIVTANKQQQEIDKVPASITVFSGIELEDKMLNTIEDMAKYTPGLDIGDYGTALKKAPSMRGLYSDYSSMSSTTGLYVDGVPVLDGTGFDETLTDIERIEVLKGPQGTLYGKNSEVGVINIITRKPDNNLMGKVTFDTASDDKRDLSFKVSGPLAKDKLYMGISGKFFEEDGFVENTAINEIVDTRKHNYGKVNLRWTPIEKLDASFILSRIKYDDGANRMNLSNASERGKIQSDIEQYNRSAVTLASLNIDYKINEKLSLISITTNRDYDEIIANDFDYSTFPGFHIYGDSEYITQSEELRLNYEGKKLKALAGLYFDKTEADIHEKWVNMGANYFQDHEMEGSSVGLFTHLTWAFTDRLSLLGGLRYDMESKDYKNLNEKIDVDETWNEISPKVAVQYQLKDNVMFYSNVSKGYRSGGFNKWSPKGYPMEYDEETLWSYEVGTKVSFWQKRASFEVSAYYMDIDDMQVDEYVDGAQNQVYKTNAAQGTSKGFETELRVKLTRDFLLFAGYSYNNCEFDEYKDVFGVYDGKKCPFSPDYDYNFGFQYRNQGGFYASADMIGYGKTYFDRSNKYSRDAYEIVNFKTGFEMESMDIYFYGKNIFDKKYDSNGIFEGYSSYSDPREIGISVSLRF